MEVRMNLSDSTLLTRSEAAAYLGVKPGTLACWAVTRRYDLPMIKVGRLVRYIRRDLDLWLEEQRLKRLQPLP